MRLVVPGRVVLRSAQSQAGACWPQEVAWNLQGTALQPEIGGGAAGWAVLWIKCQMLLLLEYGVFLLNSLVCKHPRKLSHPPGDSRVGNASLLPDKHCTEFCSSLLQLLPLSTPTPHTETTAVAECG